VRRFSKSWWIAAAACVPMVMPVGVLAEETRAPAAAEAPKEAAPRVKMKDVALTKAGTFNGRIIDDKGVAIDGVVVRLQKRGAEEFVETTTDEKGRFKFASLKGGVYDVRTPQAVQAYRMWPADAAPEQAMKVAVVTSNASVVRGQLGFLDPANATAILLGAAAVTLSAITLSEVHDVKHDVDKIPTSP
jgi:hypothetical protein